MQFNVHLTLMLVLATFVVSQDPIVHTPLGSIEGRWEVSRSGRQFQAFEGIPYAQPPVGELRFEPPQPVKSWPGVLQAKSNSSKCIQSLEPNANTKTEIGGDEDCLYMNIYTNFNGSSNEAELFPVMVFIYGGGFQTGEAVVFRPTFLMDNDLVWVSMNHRLGPFGFLSTGDGVVPGNMGLKDQLLVMEWVSKYITAFGGNPNHVTLVGLSSGAASAHLHYLSPRSRGLFHRGISVSGTAFTPWAQTEASKEKSKKLAALVGCPTSDNEMMIQCLKGSSATELAGTLNSFFGFVNNPIVPWGPVVENGSSDPFLDKSPIEIMCSGEAANLPWIMSDDTEEGIYPAAEILSSPEYTRQVDENWEEVAPYILNYNYTIPKSRHASVARRIRHYYLGDKPIDNSTRKEFVQLCGDRIFTTGNVMAALKQSIVYNSPVWFYLYAYRGEYSATDVFPGTNDGYGVAHVDEGYLLLDLPERPLHREDDIQMSLDLVKMWVPDLGVDWKPVDGSSEELDFLMISGPGQYIMKRNSNIAQINFWRSIDFNENKLPPQYPTCHRIS